MRGLLWLVASAWLLFGLSWWVLHGWIVPRIAEFRPRLEQQASKALGVPVRIGQITGRSVGGMPSFELHDVTLLDSQGREAVRLARVVGALSPSSLWGLGFEQLVIDRPELDIRRAADGKIFVGGLDVSKDSDTGHSDVADWFFSQIEFVVRDGTVRWTDEMRQAPPLALRQVDAVMRNGRQRHRMRLDATPPPEWGERFSLRGIFRQPLLTGHSGDVKTWTGQVYGDFSRVDVSQVQHYASLASLGISLNRGEGSMRAWLDVSKGKITSALADVALREVDVRLGTKLEPLRLVSLDGRLGASQHERGFDFTTEGLQFRARDGLQWPGGNLALVHTNQTKSAAENTTLKADRLDLATLGQIASRLPLDSGLQAKLASLSPEGLVETLDARWQGPLDAPTAFTVKGRVAGLRVAALPAPAPAPGRRGAAADEAVPGRPGLSGATVDFNLTQDGGQASVKIVRGALELPGIFEDPKVLLDQLTTEAKWKLAGSKIELQLRNLQFSNADAQGQAQVRWQTDDRVSGPPSAGNSPDRRFPGILDLQGSLSRGDGSRVHRYLPLVLTADVRHYVRDAVVKGQVSEVKFKVKGTVENLPFTNPAQGDFQVSAKVNKGHFVYVPPSLQPPGAAPWPALTELSGELVFNRASLEVKGASGQVAGLPGLQLVKGDARIADLIHSATVEVTTDIKGTLSDALGFVNTSPVGSMTDQVLAQATAGGSADYRFRLRLPIDDIEKSTVEGTVTLPGNDVKFAAQAPLLSRLKGVVNITDKGFSVAGAQAGLLGGDIRIDGGTRAGGAAPDNKTSVAFKAQGSVTAEGLRQAKDIGLVSRLAAHANGSAGYTASVLFRRGVPEVLIASSLQGMALNLPAPFTKSAETLLPLRFENALLPGTLQAGQMLQDQLSLTIGRLAAVNFVRDVSGAEPRVIRGGIGVGLEPGESVPAPAAGVGANINLARVDIDAWEKMLDDATGGGLSQAIAAPPSAAGSDAPTPFVSYLPTLMAVRARELTVQGRTLNHVVVGASRDGLNWRANIDATELDGYLEFRQPGAQSAGRLYARLSRLSLAASQASEVEAILEEQPASIPALDIVVENMELRGKKLGRVEIDAVNRNASAAEGGVREWRLNKFNVILPEAVLTASGNWAAVVPTGPRVALPQGERRRSAMNFKLDIADSGALLKRFGMDGVIRRGKGRLEGQVAWIGSPLDLDFPSLSGQFNVNVESGQFLKADPGIAKLLGVLSLQSLPRRLTLDFRDVFSQGFAFDFVRGDIGIQQGVARTNNLQMSGVNAAVLMEGSADIEEETQDIKVVVVPEINAGTASLIATAINPVVGLGTFLAQMFLRRPLMEAATQEFHIDGTWADPKITKINRKTRAQTPVGEQTPETKQP